MKVELERVVGILGSLLIGWIILVNLDQNGLIIFVVLGIILLGMMKLKNRFLRRWRKQIGRIEGYMMSMILELLMLLVFPWAALYLWSRLNMVEITLVYKLLEIDNIHINSTSCAYQIVLDPKLPITDFGIDMMYQGKLVNSLVDRTINLQILNALKPINTCQIHFYINPANLPEKSKPLITTNLHFPGINLTCNGKCNLIGKTGNKYLYLGEESLIISAMNKEAVMNINIGAVQAKWLKMDINAGNIQLSMVKLSENSSIVTRKGTISIQGEELRMRMDGNETYCLGGESIKKVDENISYTEYTIHSESPSPSSVSPIPIIRVRSLNGEVKGNAISNERPSVPPSHHIQTGSYRGEDMDIQFSPKAIRKLEGIIGKLKDDKNEENNIILETRGINSESSNYLKWVIAPREVYLQINPWYLAFAMMAKSHTNPYKIVANLLNTQCPYTPFHTVSQLLKINNLINDTMIAHGLHVYIALILHGEEYTNTNLNDGFLFRTPQHSERWLSIDQESSSPMLYERTVFENPSVIFLFLLTFLFPAFVAYNILKVGISIVRTHLQDIDKIRKRRRNWIIIKNIFEARNKGIYTSIIDNSEDPHYPQITDFTELEIERDELHNDNQNSLCKERATKLFTLLRITHPVKVIDHILHFLLNPFFVSTHEEFKNTCLQYSKHKSKYYLSDLKEKYDEFCYINQYGRKVELTQKILGDWGMRVEHEYVGEYRNVIMKSNIQTGTPHSTLQDFIAQACKITKGFEKEDTVLEFKFKEQYANFRHINPKQLGESKTEIHQILNKNKIKVKRKRVAVVISGERDPNKYPQFDFTNMDKENKSYINLIILIGAQFIRFLSYFDLFNDHVQRYYSITHIIIVYICAVLLIYFVLEDKHSLWRWFRNLVIYIIHLCILTLLLFPIIYLIYTIEVTYEHYTLQEYKNILSSIDFRYFPWRILPKLSKTTGFYLYVFPLIALMLFGLYYFITSTQCWLECNYPRKVHQTFFTYRTYWKFLRMMGLKKPKKYVQFLHLTKWVYFAFSIALWSFCSILWVEWLVIGTLMSSTAYMEYASFAVGITLFVYIQYDKFQELHTKALSNTHNIYSNALKETLLKGIQLYGGDQKSNATRNRLSTILITNKIQIDEKIMLGDLFKLVDLDQTGTVNVHDFSVLLRRLGKPMNKAKLTQIFTEVKTKLRQAKKKKFELQKYTLKLLFKSLNDQEKLKELKKVKKESSKVEGDGLNKHEFKSALQYIKSMDQEEAIQELKLDIPALAMKMVKISFWLGVILLIYKYSTEALSITGGFTSIIPLGSALVLCARGEQMTSILNI